MLETTHAAWRDPEFGRRLDALRAWRRDAPDRPLVLALGSSRTQYAIDPAAMGFPDRPGSPVVFNLGCRGLPPLGWWLNLQRVFDAGVRPDFVLVPFAPWEGSIGGPAEEQFDHWKTQHGAADLRRLRPYSAGPGAFRGRWARNRLAAWSAYREGVMSDLLPDWQTARQRWAFHGWERMDRYGYTPNPLAPVAPADRERLFAAGVVANAGAFDGRGISAESDRAFRDLIGRCRSEGIPVAFFWAPESPAYRARYTPAGRAAAGRYVRFLADDLGVPVFPCPGHLAEEDFADGYHMLPHGAVEYSRWLAETHVKPWLAAHGVGR